MFCQPRRVPRVNFGISYSGRELHPTFLISIEAKSAETCVDINGIGHAFITTLIPKRVSNIEKGIAAWNLSQKLDVDKICLTGENVVTFSKTAGSTAADHAIVKTIQEQRRNSQYGKPSTYSIWNSESDRVKKKRSHSYLDALVDPELSETSSDDDKEKHKSLVSRLEKHKSLVSRLQAHFDGCRALTAVAADMLAEAKAMTEAEIS